MKPAVMVDIDDTLADTQTNLLAYVNARASRPYVYEQLTRRFREGAVAEYNRLVTEYLRQPTLVFAHILLPGSRRSLERLHEAGYAVHIVSSRKENLHEITRAWLVHHGLMAYVTTVHGRSAQVRGNAFKVAVAKATQAVAAFDDTYDVAEALADAGVEAYLMDRPWNQDEPLIPHMHRAESLEAAVDAFLASR
jgi:phosphoglycolate phosphatase-like HAD superfamily hydrolase